MEVESSEHKNAAMFAMETYKFPSFCQVDPKCLTRGSPAASEKAINKFVHCSEKQDRVLLAIGKDSKDAVPVIEYVLSSYVIIELHSLPIGSAILPW